MKQTTVELKEETENSTIIDGFNIPLSIVNRNSTEISKEIRDLNSTINQIHLISKYNNIQQQNTYFSQMHMQYFQERPYVNSQNNS